MAVPQHFDTVPNTPLQNRYTHDEDKVETRLPSGRCNYKNLNSGGNAPTCGCKRYWDQALATPRNGFGVGISRSQGSSGFCMCEHHACYHDDVPEGNLGALSNSIRAEGASRLSIQQLPQRPEFAGQGLVSDEGSELGRPPSTLPDTLQFNRYIHTGSSIGLPAIPSQCLLPSDNGSMTSGSQLRYSRPFGGLGLGTLSHIPTPGSAAAATAAKSGQLEPPQVKERQMQVYKDANGNDCLQSLTEGATPSAEASQDPTDSDFDKNIVDVQNALGKLAEKKSQGYSAVALRPMSKDSSSTPIKQSASVPAVNLSAIADAEEDGYLIPRLRVLVSHLSDYPNKVQNHERRLDLLENTSFVNPVIDDLVAVDERMDTRVSDLEDRVIELEKAHAARNDASSVGSKQLANTSFDSRASVTSSAMIASAIGLLDPPRIEILEAHVAELQAAALPSYSRPWKIEVVFLPYGSNLMGIWSTQHGITQRSRLNSTATDTWTQTEQNTCMAQAQLTAHDQTVAWERSATDLGDQEDNTWLMARACGRGSRIYERLRSRGLVKTVQIMGPDARDVQSAMLTSFGDLPTTLKEDPYAVHEDESTGAVPEQLRSYLGLQSSWVPLRKVHKDSCLRFLTPSEMITQALWTAPFLASSVAMRQKDVKRLYVTQSDSYVQHLSDEPAEWTWQKLRQLPRVYPDQQNSNHTPEADAHEPCWEFDDRLDPVEESFRFSFASHISSLSLRSPALGQEELELESPSDHFSSAPRSLNTSTTPTSVALTNLIPLSPVKERHPFRPIHTRTLSMPSLVPLKTSQAGKRRITSFEQEIHSSPSRVPSTSGNLFLKRRRISRSPSRPQDTPRYSTGPPSPYNYVDDSGPKPERGLTPFAYATPHSNAPPYVDHSRARSGIGIYEDEDEDDSNEGGEANALSEEDDDKAMYVELERQLDEEWEGVEDEGGDGLMMRYESREVTRPTAVFKPEDDDEDNHSDASSAPSVYPSTQQPDGHGLFSGSTKAGFRIHVDEEADV